MRNNPLEMGGMRKKSNLERAFPLEGEGRKDSIETRVFGMAVDMHTDKENIDPDLLAEVRLLATSPRLKREIKEFLEEKDSENEDGEIEMNPSFRLRAKEQACASYIAEKMAKLINANIMQRVSREVLSDVTGGDPVLLKKGIAVLSSQEFKASFRKMLKEKGITNIGSNLNERTRLLKDVLHMLLEGELSE
ncbi:MAG: hypothetical protein WAV73_00215 [Candidatus Moraniibacteriota bacterium]